MASRWHTPLQAGHFVPLYRDVATGTGDGALGFLAPLTLLAFRVRSYTLVLY